MGVSRIPIVASVIGRPLIAGRAATYGCGLRSQAARACAVLQ
jgi:hypothetical protein